MIIRSADVHKVMRKRSVGRRNGRSMSPNVFGSTRFTSFGVGIAKFVSLTRQRDDVVRRLGIVAQFAP